MMLYEGVIPDHPKTELEELRKRVEKMQGVLETLLAIEYLEYHDKNWLSQLQFSPARWNEEKRALIKYGLSK